MKINNITPQIITNRQLKTSNSSAKYEQFPQIQNSQPLATPTSANYVAYQPNFEGGYSINLAETIQNLDKLASKHSDVYPKNVREWAQMILEEGNRNKNRRINDLLSRSADNSQISQKRLYTPGLRDTGT